MGPVSVEVGHSFDTAFPSLGHIQPYIGDPEIELMVIWQNMTWSSVLPDALELPT